MPNAALRDHVLFRYSVPVLAVVLGTLVRWLLQDFFGEGAVFRTYYPAVALVAMFAGGGPGILATILSVIVVMVGFDFGFSSANGVVTHGLFIASGVIISSTAEMLRRAQQREADAIAGRLVVQERELAEQDERYRLLADHAEDFVSLAEPGGNRLYVSPSFYRRTGWTPEEIQGTDWRLQAHPDDIPLVTRTRAANRAGQTTTIEYRICCRDGSWLWVESRCKPVTDAAGQIRRLVLSARDITERKLAEAERQKFVSLADSSLEFIGMCDRDFRPFYVNAAGLRLIGLDDLEAARRIKVQDCFFPEDQPLITNEFFPRVVREGHGEVEIRFRHFQTGEAIWMLYNVFNIRDANGAIIGWATVSQNINERKRAEQKLRDSERLRRLVLDAVPHYVFAKNREGRFLFVNRFMAERNGYTSPDEMIGVDERDTAPDKTQLEKFWRDDRQVIDSGQPLIIPSETVTDCDGQTRIVQTTKLPFTFPGTNEPAVLGVAVDITQQKQAELALAENVERLRSILSTAADAIVVINRRGLIDSVNAAAETMFGYSAAELIGQNVKILMPSPYHDEHDVYLRRYDETGQARIIGSGREVTARRKDGSIFPVDLTVSQVDHLGLFTGILRDLSERKELQKQVLDISVEEQRRIGQELHDGTQQELTALMLVSGTLLDLLREAPEERDAARSVWRIDEPSYTRLCEITMKLCQRLAEVSQHVRQLAHGIIPVQIDAEGLASALHELAESTNGLHGITCRFHCPEQVPVANNTTATYLYRIAQEALNNALRHSQASEIEISLAKQDGQFVLEVRDNGVGFDAASAAHSARTGRIQAMGLRIMEYRAGMIGGTLRIERGATKGTSVKCVISRGLNGSSLR